MMAYFNIDPKLDTTPTDVKIIHPCLIHGQPRKIGDVVTVARQDAFDLSAMKRVEIVSK